MHKALHCFDGAKLTRKQSAQFILSPQKQKTLAIARVFQLPQTGIEPVREYKSRRILSPVRLPVPPLRHNQISLVNGTNRARTCDPLLVRQVLSQLSYDPLVFYLTLKIFTS